MARIIRKIEQPTSTPDKTAVIEQIEISKIHVDMSFQLRSPDGTLPLAEQTAKEYADYGPEKLPPVVIARSKDSDLNYQLLAGFTRLRAFKMNEATIIPVRIVDVSNKTEALKIAAASNSEHGLRPKKADLILAMQQLDGAGVHRIEIAELLKVSAATVSRLLKPKQSAEEKAAREAVLDDPTLSNKEAAEKLAISTSAVSQARKKRNKQEEAENEEFSNENAKHPQEESPSITMAMIYDQTNDFYSFLKETIDANIVPTSSGLHDAILSAKKSIKRLLRDYKNHTDEG